MSALKPFIVWKGIQYFVEGTDLDRGIYRLETGEGDVFVRVNNVRESSPPKALAGDVEEFEFRTAKPEPESKEEATFGGKPMSALVGLGFPEHRSWPLYFAWAAEQRGLTPEQFAERMVTDRDFANEVGKAAIQWREDNGFSGFPFC